MSHCILGINAFHGDSAAALVVDGKLVAAAEEERFRRVKHWAGLPAEAVRYCLDEAGVAYSDVDVVAINGDPRAALLQKVAFGLVHRPSPAYVLSRLRNRGKRQDVAIDLGRALDQPFRGRLARIEHHRAHLSSAFHVSPFDQAVVVSVDGFGDFASAAWGVGQGTKIRIDGRVHFPHSLGVFYQAMTQYLGFDRYGDEYKVMGLAPYGEPTYVEQLRKVVRQRPDGRYELDLRYFEHHRAGFQYTWEGGEPQVGILYAQALSGLLGRPRRKEEPLEQRHRDIAHSTQVVYEEAFFHLLNRLHERYRIGNLALAGGCAMNSVANGKVTRRTPFERLYVQSAAGDAGGAIGAAFCALLDTDGGAPRTHIDHAYWGPSYGADAIAQFVSTWASAIEEAGCTIQRMTDEGALCATAAEAIADGHVVGWFQGRMEWGPRALGNRSIVCDPRRGDMKDILNRKIKRRESFRPFAPSVLREAVAEWFELDDDVPFMMKVFPIRREKRALIPAVTHVDGTGRLQTVYRHTNPRYYRLIEEFARRTSVPMVLNTSFNENEPVVCTPQQALDCFLRTRMDMLVLGDWVLARRGSQLA
jgi:carbamoyltransferase